MIRDGTAVGPRHHSRLLALILARGCGRFGEQTHGCAGYLDVWLVW